MKAYWVYMCDLGHSWSLFRDVEAEEQREDTFCPFGHEAVTLRKSVAADRVEITIRPAAQIADPVTGTTVLQNKYYLVLEGIHSEIQRSSRNPYSWEQIIHLIGRFRDLPSTRAWQLFDSIEHAGDDENRGAVPGA